MIEGMSGLEKRLNELDRTDLSNGIGKAISFVQEAAKSGCPVHDGELRESIYVSVETEGEVVRGTCYTNKGYGPYVEFGTGPKGQASHEGISPNVAVAYTQNPWWIHESQIDKAVAEKYHFFSIKTPQGIFYQCTGQAAQPFMYPALKNNKDKAKKIIADATKKSIRKGQS